MIRTLSLFSILLALAACTTQQQPAQQSAAEHHAVVDQQALDVAETVFRYQFKQQTQHSSQGEKAYFISVLRADPSSDFLRRFALHLPPVQPGSEFHPGRGLAFRVDTVTFANADNAEVRGGFDDGLSTLTHSIYRVLWTNERWVVASETLR